ADKKTWWDKHPIDGTDVNENKIGPYGGHRFDGVYRPIDNPVSDKEAFSSDEYEFESDNTEFKNAGYTKVGNEFGFESGNSEFKFENGGYTKAGDEFEFEEEFENFEQGYENESSDTGEFENPNEEYEFESADISEFENSSLAEETM